VFATPEKYGFCCPMALNWNDVRCPLILETIRSHQPEIVCLQEVQIDTWYEDLLPSFRSLNYTCILQNVTRNHPVACAALVKEDAWNVIAVESRSRALIVVLQEKRHPRTETLLYLATVHLDARWDQDATRYSQIKSLLKRLEYHHQLQQNALEQRTGPPPEPIVIIAGDFNMLRSNPIHHLLATGVSETPGALSSALLPLHDVFGRENPSVASSSKTPTLRRTFAGGSILDYIWVSPAFSVQPWIMDERCTQRPNRQQYYRWPAMDQPSDHLPIGMTFSFGGGLIAPVH
jgi:mRNA deadenylase 3'-5' endonuclease subunit Ccr4